MNYTIIKPSPFLSRYVKYYWSISKRLPVNKEHIQRIVPSGLFELAFYLNDKPVSTDKNKSITDNVIISGQQKEFYDIKVTGELNLFAIYFYPYGLSLFLDLPISELYNQSLPLRFIQKDVVTKFEDELSAVDTPHERVQKAEKILTEQITGNQSRNQYPRIKNAIEIINTKKGNTNIEGLASMSFLSRKQFERTFSDIIGTTPKQFLKIIRFQNAIYQKSLHPTLNLTELAYKCGYYDQAHMINEFKMLTGLTPRQYFSDCAPYSDYFDESV